MQDEDLELESKPPRFSPKVWKRLLPYVKPFKKRFIVLITTLFAAALIDIAFPLLNGYLIDNNVSAYGGATTGGIWTFFAVYLAVIIVQAFLIIISTRTCLATEVSVTQTLRNALFNKYQDLSVGWFNDKSVGYLVAKTTSDTERLGSMAAWQLFDIVWNVTYIAGMFVAILVLDFRLGLVLLVLIPVSVAVSVAFNKRLLKMNRAVRRANSQIAGALNEGITGAKTGKTLVVENLLTDEFRGLTRDMYSKSNRYNRFNCLYVATLITLGACGGTALIFALGANIYIGGGMSLGKLSTLIAYTLGMTWPIMQIAAGLTAVVSNQANAERVLSVLDEKNTVYDRPDVLEKYGDSYNPKRENWEEIRGDIEFKNVSFRYPGSETYILKDFNLKIPARSTLAIAGETGAGKTTIVNLLCRFYEPESGQILIDGTDYRERGAVWLYAQLGYVLQTPHLFSGTIRDNIKYGRPDMSDAEMERAARLVKCDGVVAKLEKGYDSEVGECGDMLSTGEKQLISFARAVAADPKIFILDEATSSIDTHTEHLIQTAINGVLKNRTSVVIAHRLSTIKTSDTILIIENGKIAESGAHDELMALKGKYFDLYSKLSEIENADKVFGTD